MAGNEPETLVKVATSFDDLEDLVKRFSTDIINVPSVMGNTVQYGFFEDSPTYFFMISQQIKKQIEPKYSYNIILSVTSESSELNQEVYKKLIEKTRLEFMEAPEFLTRNTEIFNQMFYILKFKGKDALINTFKALHARDN